VLFGNRESLTAVAPIAAKAKTSRLQPIEVTKLIGGVGFSRDSALRFFHRLRLAISQI